MRGVVCFFITWLGVVDVYCTCCKRAECFFITRLGVFDGDDRFNVTYKVPPIQPHTAKKHNTVRMVVNNYMNI